MRPKLLLDMNLSPEWAPTLQKRGWEAVHWSDVGDPRASDKDIMDWAVAHEPTCSPPSSKRSKPSPPRWSP